MPRWIILFRGINVGGHRKIPMADLRAALTEAGCDRVASYIQSGNLVAGFAGQAATIGAMVRRVVRERFGFDVDLVILTPAQLAQALAELPFEASGADPSRVHLFFHLNPDAPVDIADLAADDDTSACVSGSLAHYLSTPDGMSKSNLAEKLSRRLGQSATARNLRTCYKLLEMAETA